MAGIIEGLFNSTFRGTQRMMDLTSRRNEALSSNIANAETPGYRASDVNFAQELEQAFGQKQEAVMRTSSGHLAGSELDQTAHLVPDLSGATKCDGNNVDIDIQMGRLAYNSGQYTMAANFMRKQFQIMLYAIREGIR